MAESTSTATEVAVAATLWTIAIALGVVGTTETNHAAWFWALMLTTAAGLVTGHLIVRHTVRQERINVERLLDCLVARASEREAAAKVSQIPRR